MVNIFNKLVLLVILGNLNIMVACGDSPTDLEGGGIAEPAGSRKEPEGAGIGELVESRKESIDNKTFRLSSEDCERMTQFGEDLRGGLIMNWVNPKQITRPEKLYEDLLKPTSASEKAKKILAEGKDILNKLSDDNDFKVIAKGTSDNCYKVISEFKKDLTDMIFWNNPAITQKYFEKYDLAFFTKNNQIMQEYHNKTMEKIRELRKNLEAKNPEYKSNEDIDTKTMLFYSLYHLGLQNYDLYTNILKTIKDDLDSYYTLTDIGTNTNAMPVSRNLKSDNLETNFLAQYNMHKKNIPATYRLSDPEFLKSRKKVWEAIELWQKSCAYQSSLEYTIYYIPTIIEYFNKFIASFLKP